jgi:hypothetical protein
MDAPVRERAPAGGMIGVNVEFYEGGKFLPSRADRPKQGPPPHLAHGARHEMAPYILAPAPADWHVALYPSAKVFADHAYLQQTDRYRVHPHLIQAPAYMERQPEIDNTLQRLNRHESWALGRCAGGYAAFPSRTRSRGSAAPSARRG